MLLLVFRKNLMSRTNFNNVHLYLSVLARCVLLKLLEVLECNARFSARCILNFLHTYIGLVYQYSLSNSFNEIGENVDVILCARAGLISCLTAHFSEIPAVAL